MAKLALLLSAFLVVVVSVSGAISPSFEASPKGSGKKGSEGLGKHGGPGHHGHHHHQPPPFLAKVKADALKQFKTIMANDDLTKTKREAQLDKWAAGQGKDIKKAFDEWKEKKKTKRAEVRKNINDIVQNVGAVMKKIEKIVTDASLTRKQVKEQISKILAKTSPSVARGVKAIGRAARPKPDFQKLGGLKMKLGKGAPKKPAH